MGPARGWALLAVLLLPGSCLRCLQCADEACAPVTCAAHESRCRATLLTTVDEPPRAPRELRREERGCAPAPAGDVSGNVSASVTFRSRGQLVTLQELLCAGDLCNGGPAPRPRAHPSAALECFTCDDGDDGDDGDGSCSGPALGRLRCPDPRDRCLALTLRLGPGGLTRTPGPAGGLTRTPGPAGGGRLAQALRGCGRLGPCRGLLGLDTGQSLRLARCCEGSGCNGQPEEPGAPNGAWCLGCEGPAPHGCAPRPLACRGALTHCALVWGTHDASGDAWALRGCATQAWCEAGAPLGLGGLLGPPRCCQGPLCNRLPGDPPDAGAPRAAPPPALGLLLLLGAAVAAA
ncbi:urokinase plasminogen activator surface receptor [Dromaius novaehollandiae]|uniref:urokinase plasminogen activator surface receptor n=1 Tax=Dromaius novaehollandiae TaxID=8790 RepID=UPI00311EAFB2